VVGKAAGSAWQHGLRGSRAGALKDINQNIYSLVFDSNREMSQVEHNSDNDQDREQDSAKGTYSLFPR
jgi:hypothetical protein